MNYLVDTHIFLWITQAPELLPEKIKFKLLDSGNNKFVSVITFWEISLKYSLGKLDLKGSLPEQQPKIAEKTGFKILNLEQNITSSFHKLPIIKNKDPFDRMLAWQAISLEYTLLTQDKTFANYKMHGLEIYS